MSLPQVELTSGEVSEQAGPCDEEKRKRGERKKGVSDTPD